MPCQDGGARWAGLKSSHVWASRVSILQQTILQQTILQQTTVVEKRFTSDAISFQRMRFLFNECDSFRVERGKPRDGTYFVLKM